MDKTIQAVELLIARFEKLGVKKALFYLEQQVSNSGRVIPTAAFIQNNSVRCDHILHAGELAIHTGVQLRLNLHPSAIRFMDRGYDTKSASTFVGNHHLLSERQRMALARIVSTASAVQRRKRKELQPGEMLAEVPVGQAPPQSDASR